MTPRPSTVLLALLPLGLAAGLVACDGSLFQPGEEEEQIRAYVHVTQVERGSVEHTLEVTGTVQAGRQVDLVTDIPGKVERLPVQVGDTVARGQLLAQLDTEMARLQLQQAEAAVGLAQIGWETGMREFKRAEALHQSGTLTDQQYEQARSGLDMSELQVSQATAAKGLATKQVTGGALYAPFPGYVTYVAVEEGEYFNPMTISPMAGPAGLVGLVDLDTIKVDLQVTDRDVGKLSVGMPAHIHVDAVEHLLPEDGLAGRIDYIGHAADTSSRTFPVRVVDGNPDHAIRAGMHARIRLVLEAADDVLWLPEEAIGRSEGSTYAMVVSGETATRVPVQLGLVGNDTVEVTSGLSGGEQVVVEGLFGLPNGARVQVVE